MSYPNWSVSIPLPTGVTGKQIVAENSKSWLLTSAGQIHKYTGSSWSLIPSHGTSEKLVSLSVATDSSVIAIGESNGVYHYNIYGWTKLESVTGNAAAIGDNSHYVVVNGPKITAYETYSERDISAPVEMKQISATEMLQHVWGVDTTGAIHSLAGNSWIPVPSPPGATVTSVHVSLSASYFQVYCVDTYGTGYCYDTNGTWAIVFNPTFWNAGFSHIEARAGFVHAHMTNEELYVGTI